MASILKKGLGMQLECLGMTKMVIVSLRIKLVFKPNVKHRFMLMK